MMEFVKKNAAGLFLIDLADYELPTREKYLLYNPRTGMRRFADGIDEAASIVSSEQNRDTPALSRPVQDHAVSCFENFNGLTLILNHRCNFSCSYCYSAQNRDIRNLKDEDIRTLIDAVTDNIRSRKTDDPFFYLSFGGGGEPFLDWQQICSTIHYTEQTAKKKGLKTEYSFTTNGSLIGEEQAEFLCRYNVKAYVSFEILPDIQERQRGDYAKSAAGITALVQRNIPTVPISVITPLSVLRQAEMVETLHQNFPEIKRANFEHVVDSDLFRNSAAGLRDFFKIYTREFHRADQLARRYGIILKCGMKNKMDFLRVHSCVGGLNLTADGITFCPMVTHRNDLRFPQFCYGKIRNGSVIIDRKQLQNWPPPAPAATCKDCFACLHCGGLCPVAWGVYSPEMREEYCRFMKYYLLYHLLYTEGKCTDEC